MRTECFAVEACVKRRLGLDGLDFRSLETLKMSRSADGFIGPENNQMDFTRCAEKDVFFVCCVCYKWALMCLLCRIECMCRLTS